MDGQSEPISNVPVAHRKKEFNKDAVLHVVAQTILARDVYQV